MADHTGMGVGGDSFKAVKQQAGVKMTPAEVVMRSIESGRKACELGDLEQAVRILKSVDDICKRAEAPPPVHGLGLRCLSDAYLLKGQIDEARTALQEGITMNEAALKRPGLPEQFRQDVAARLGDLCAAMGELERQAKNWKEALRALRRAAEHFGTLEGAQHFQSATLNRVGFTYLEKGALKEAMAELVEAAAVAETVPDDSSKSALLGANYRHHGVALQLAGDAQAAKAMFERALALATQVQDADLVADINDKLGGVFGNMSLAADGAVVEEGGFL